MLNTTFSKEDLKNAGIDEPTGLPIEVANKMRAYARELKTQYPHFKPQRIANKVASKFKVQVVLKEPAVSANTPE